MNKKAADVEMIHVIMMGIILLLVVGFYILFMSILYSGTRSITPIQEGIILERLLYDSNGIIFEENERAYPGVIDAEKFTSERLSSALDYSYGSRPGVQLKLSSEGLPVQTIYLNKDQYYTLLPAAQIEGAGRAKMLHKHLPVLLKQGGQTLLAELDITIVAVRQ